MNDIEFLKELQNTLNTQEIDSQASPRFWVLRDMRRTIVPSDFADGSMIVDNDGNEYPESRMEDFIEIIIDDLEDENWNLDRLERERIIDELKELKEQGNTVIDPNEVYEVLESYGCNELYDLFDYVNVWFIVPNTMFLTKKEAKEHIEYNHYHYTKHVHTYAMTAWRSPAVSKLMDILMNHNWESEE